MLAILDPGWRAQGRAAALRSVVFFAILADFSWLKQSYNQACDIQRSVSRMTSLTEVDSTLPLRAVVENLPRSAARRAALRQLEHALLTDGWFRLSLSELGVEAVNAVRGVYAEAAAYFEWPSALRLRHERKAATDAGALGFTYLPQGAEPLYDATATEQHVHSLNAHAPLSEAECDALLPVALDAEARSLAHSYHRWPNDPALVPLRVAITDLRHRIESDVCVLVHTALAALLGLDESALSGRCRMRRSDNTSLLRLLQYPALHPAVDHAESAEDSRWGVSEHTDYELFSVLHQDRAGLELRNRRGEWVLLPHSPDVLTVIVGDMTERLSAGYFVATPHRVRPTPPAAPPRHSFVYFQALDEDERVSALSSARAQRPTGAAPFLAFLQQLPDKSLRCRGNTRTSRLPTRPAPTPRVETRVSEPLA